MLVMVLGRLVLHFIMVLGRLVLHLIMVLMEIFTGRFTTNNVDAYHL